MSSRPNFTEARMSGGSVIVRGQTDPEPEGDVVGIRVVLAQRGHTATDDVPIVGQNWEIEFPGDGFSAGPATAFGVETRRENATTTTWAQTIEITS